MPEVDEKMGICVKDSQLMVVQQNGICRSVCGDNLHQRCNFGCMEIVDKLDPVERIQEGFNTFKKVMVNHKLCDVNLLITKGEIVTMLHPLIEGVEKIKAMIEEYNLTAREGQVFELLVENFRNREIAKELYISLATVKTHLNNIYKKIPFELQRA